MTSRAWLPLVLCSVLAAACANRGVVTRVVDGRLVQVRSVPEEAYAAYLAGVVHENRGELDAAENAYATAIGHDPESAEIWTRIGAVRCARAKRGGPGPSPWEAFRRAEALDPGMEDAWTARARCHLDLGEIELATQAARRAVAADPDRTDAVVWLARALERAGRSDEARVWMDGLVLRDPTSVSAQIAMIEFATHTGDAPRLHAATEALGRLRGDRIAAAAVSDIDDALARGETERARALAEAAGVRPSALALRAVALGQIAFARERAALVASADPADSDARIAAAVAADLARDEAALTKAVSALTTEMTPPSVLGRALLLELVDRRCMIGAAADEHTPANRHPADPLLAKVLERRLGAARPQ